MRIKQIFLPALLALLLLAGCRSAGDEAKASFFDAIAPLPGQRMSLSHQHPLGFAPGDLGEVRALHKQPQTVWVFVNDDDLQRLDSGGKLRAWLQNEGALHFHTPEGRVFWLPDKSDADIRFVFRRGLGQWLDDADAARMWVRIGAQLRKAKDVGGAIEAYQKAVSLDESLLEANLGLGEALLARGKAADALTPLMLAVQLEPENGSALRLLGNAYLKLKRYRLAVAPLTRAWLLAPDNPRQLIGVALALGRSGEKETALRVLDEASLRITNKKLQGDIKTLRAEFSADGG